MKPILHGSLSLTLLVMAVIILEPSCCHGNGAVLPKSMNDTSSTTTSVMCDSRMEECLIVSRLDDDLEFQMPSEISRRILAIAPKTATKALNPYKGLCERKDKRYDQSCLPNQNPGAGTQQKCGPYTRMGCHE